uniref:Calponin-homology (CH) domain-containing protein n=1 Tax=Amphimedon queenslandica TaxID=400682 RepID=A0A1X7SLA5_AMPQE
MDGPDNLLETQAGRSALRVTTTAYTKWINAHFKAAGEEELTDLFNDLRDGSKLMTLIEILTGTKLVREKGKTRNHHMINITTVIDFLQSKEKVIQRSGGIYGIYHTEGLRYDKAIDTNTELYNQLLPCTKNKQLVY